MCHTWKCFERIPKLEFEKTSSLFRENFNRKILWSSSFYTMPVQICVILIPFAVIQSLKTFSCQFHWVHTSIWIMVIEHHIWIITRSWYWTYNLTRKPQAIIEFKLQFPTTWLFTWINSIEYFDMRDSLRYHKRTPGGNNFSISHCFKKPNPDNYCVWRQIFNN